MKRRYALISPAALIVLLFAISACGASGNKTEVLPADGGEPGKAFVQLQSAFKSADKAAAQRLLDPAAWHLDNKEKEWFAGIYEPIAAYGIAGGRRQGDRATLFVHKQGYYAMVNATQVSGGWRFDSPLPVGTSFSSTARDCKAFPTRFPCGALSAPDAGVSGVVQSRRIDPETKSPFPAVKLFDGLAVRMVDRQTKALKSTWIVLSGTGINPRMVALSEEPDDVRRWLHWPVLTLDVAPDGRSAKATYYDGISSKDFDVTSGLGIDTKKPNRISGRLKMDLKDTAKFDIVFDIGTASDCLADQYHCGE